MSMNRLARQVSLVLVLGLLGLSPVACISIGTPVPPTKAVTTADTPTPIVIVVTATPVPIPAATNTPVPPPPSATATKAPPAPSATATKAPLPPPVLTLVPAASPTPMCQELPVRGFGKVWAENEAVRNFVGCPSYPKSEMGVDFTAQRFEQGVIFYTSASGYFDKDSVLVLFRDNKTWSKVVVPADAAPAPIGPPPAGKFAPQGRIGYVWQQAAGVRTRLGWALEPEKSGTVASGTNAAWQAFSRGYLYWIPWNQPDDRYIYVVATSKPYPPGGSRFDWLEYKDTWNP